MRLEEKVAERAFDLAKGKGKRIPRNRNHCKGGWKYGNRYFSITAIFADSGPNFGGCDLSDCLYLNVSYKGKRVFRYNGHNGEVMYKPGIWEDKLKVLTEKASSEPLPKFCIWGQRSYVRAHND